MLEMNVVTEPVYRFPSRRICAHCDRMTAKPMSYVVHANSGPGSTWWYCEDCVSLLRLAVERGQS